MIQYNIVSLGEVWRFRGLKFETGTFIEKDIQFNLNHSHLYTLYTHTQPLLTSPTRYARGGLNTRTPHLHGHMLKGNNNNKIEDKMHKNRPHLQWLHCLALMSDKDRNGKKQRHIYRPFLKPSNILFLYIF